MRIWFYETMENLVAASLEVLQFMIMAFILLTLMFD